MKRILIANDDGHQSEGLRALVEAVSPLAEVWVVAPETEQSASSHAISLHRPLRIRELRPRWFAVDGTPTDCSYVGVNHVLKEQRPDLMLSGINHGPNMADDVTYSGTVAAAMEASLLGVPSIAFSLATRRGFDFGPAARFAGAFVAAALAQPALPAHMLLNVNIPSGVEPEGYVLTRQGKHSYGFDVIEKLDPRGRRYYWIGGSEYSHEDIPGSDCNVVLREKRVSVTPLQLDLTHHGMRSQLGAWEVPGYRQFERPVSPGTPLEALETPAVLVDLDVLERNVARMAERARAAGVRLRPHAKTHKCPEIGRLQLRAGASGLSLAKTGEAEAFAEAGFDDLFVAFPVVGADKGRRLLALAERVRLRVGVDSLPGAQSLAQPFAAAGRSLDVLLKVDVGYHRVGVPPEHALELARQLAELRGLRLRGLFTHAGHAYLAETPAGVAEIGRHEARCLAEVAERLRAAGLALEEVSVGSTPTASHALAAGGVSECRPGNYVFHDASQVSLGTCALEDCALTVLATVVSAPGPGRAFLDAGSKTLSSDPLRPRPGGHGLILGRRSRLSGLSEEHGWVSLCEGESLEVGERVRVLPNHACVVANLHDRLYGVRAGRVEQVLAVAARGRVS